MTEDKSHEPLTYEHLEKLNKALEENTKYWYMFFIEECVLCGNTHEHKMRMYGIPKPEDKSEQYHYTQFVCGEHFL